MPGLHSSHWKTRAQEPPKLGTHARSTPVLSNVTGVRVSLANDSHFRAALGDRGRGPRATALRSETLRTYMHDRQFATRHMSFSGCWEE